MICKYCGAQTFDNSKFCLKCGRGIDGKINPSDKEQAKEQFVRDILPICKRYSRTLDSNREIDSSYAKFLEKSDALEHIKAPIDLPSAISLVITAIMVAVFSILIPGLNFDNENFHWIVQSKSFALAVCSSTGFIPFYALYHFLSTLFHEEYELFNIGHIIKSIVIGLLSGAVSTLILGFLKGFLGKGFITMCIVLSILLVVFAIILVIRLVIDIANRERFYESKREIEILRATYERNFNNEVKPYKEKYKGILSNEELDSCVLNAKSTISNQNISELADILRKL